jgi:Tol biopolymer transport system component
LLASDIGEAFAVSPDGGRIALIRQVPASADFVQPTPAEGEEAPPPINTIPQLFVAPLDDLDAAQQITQMVGTVMSRPAWTPDGARIVFSSNQDGDSELYIIDAAGGSAPTALTDNTANDTDPTISPDGRTVVYASDAETPGSPELFSISIQGGEARQLTNASGSSTSPAFSPDGSRIAFVSDRAGDGDIWIMDSNGQRPFLVTIDDGDAEDRAPAWTPDSRWIVFASNRDGGSFQVYLVSPDGTTLLPVTSGIDNIQSIGSMPMSLPG